MSGPGAKFAPIPDKLAVSSKDAQLFIGALWMMAPGSWQVRVTVDGAQGKGEIAIPVPSAARVTKTMRFGLGALLSVLGLFLVAGVVAMAGAAKREANLDPGVKPTAKNFRAARIAMVVALFVVAGALWGGNAWWSSEASSYGKQVYKPIEMQAALDNSGVLTLNLTDPGWLRPRNGRISFFSRSVDDLIPDHNHLMHLYAIRQPGLDAVYHLHPEQTGSGIFRLSLPAMPSGEYKLYADVVHANGFPETLVSTIQVPELAGRPLSGDDAGASATPWSQAAVDANTFVLPDKYKMVWLRPENLRVRQAYLFRFRLETPSGTAPNDMAFYMGMLGHAAFVKTDATVFAHIHPTGSVSMAAFMLAQQQANASSASGNGASMQNMDMPGMSMPGMDDGTMQSGSLPNEVSFPYGFPSPGRYRLIIQMKHGQTVETGVFDANVS